MFIHQNGSTKRKKKKYIHAEVFVKKPKTWVITIPFYSFTALNY